MNLPTRHERDAMGARAIALGLDEYVPGPCEPEPGEDPDAEPEPERWTCRDCGESFDWELDEPEHDGHDLVCAYCMSHNDDSGTDDTDRRYDDWKDRQLFGD